MYNNIIFGLKINLFIFTHNISNKFTPPSKPATAPGPWKCPAAQRGSPLHVYLLILYYICHLSDGELKLRSGKTERGMQPARMEEKIKAAAARRVRRKKILEALLIFDCWPQKKSIIMALRHRHAPRHGASPAIHPTTSDCPEKKKTYNKQRANQYDNNNNTIKSQAQTGYRREDRRGNTSGTRFRSYSNKSQTESFNGFLYF